MLHASFCVLGEQVDAVGRCLFVAVAVRDLRGSPETGLKLPGRKLGASTPGESWRTRAQKRTVCGVCCSWLPSVHDRHTVLMRVKFFVAHLLANSVILTRALLWLRSSIPRVSPRYIRSSPVFTINQAFSNCRVSTLLLC